MPKFILLALVVSIFGFGHRAWASCDPGDQRCLHQQSENHEVSIADLQARVQALEGQLVSQTPTAPTASRLDRQQTPPPPVDRCAGVPNCTHE